MRFDRKNPLTAEEIVNEYSEKKLADIIYTYGEERYSRQIARAIIKSRPLRTTLQLAEVIKKAIPHSNNSIHPATRTFQALRIAVNNELEAIEKVLPQSLHSLCVGGKLAVISFHSLEDRIVKQYFQKESKDCICPPKQPVCTCGHKASIKWVTRHFISPSEQEKLENPRSRSAKLRVVEKVA
jgi:16S rRNA (cytosine1402-N4)-methyltransferase